jgi:hypothetical protein
VEFIELTNGNKGEIKATPGMVNEAGYHGNVVLSKYPILQTKIIRLHHLDDYLYRSKTRGMDAGERRLGGRMALFATTLVGNTEFLLISMHTHAGSKKHLLQRDAEVVCNQISLFNSSVVIIGGDIYRDTVDAFVEKCGFLPLEATNQKEGNAFKSSWKVNCPNAGPPVASKGRGDWVLARGEGLRVDKESLTTVHPYVKSEDDTYECISDHSIVGFQASLSSEIKLPSVQ